MGVLDRHDRQKQKGYKGMEMKESTILSPRDDSQGQIIAILSSEREKRERREKESRK